MRAGSAFREQLAKIRTATIVRQFLALIFLTFLAHEPPVQGFRQLERHPPYDASRFSEVVGSLEGDRPTPAPAETAHPPTVHEDLRISLDSMDHYDLARLRVSGRRVRLRRPNVRPRPNDL